MGIYLNPGNSGFVDILSGVYVDKTGLIAEINSMISTRRKMLCVSRPRRFGKSYAAQMLCAYYDRTVDSHALFDGLKIASMPGYADHLNKYNVIYVDITGVKPYCDNFKTLVPFLKEKITCEICRMDTRIKEGNDLLTTLVDAVEVVGSKFVVIIDEWDAPLRENIGTERDYLDLLRSLFKNSGVTAKIFAAVYMTGILPIIKVKTQSALSEFEEYTMLDPVPFEAYVGFTEDEVRALCGECKVDFAEMKRWYDGYEMPNVGAIYNPNSVMRAIWRRKFDPYWSLSSAANNLLDLISYDVDGLRQTITELMGGVEVEIDTTGYNNDMTYTTRDAALTMLTHLGYLAYNQEEKTVRIPNEEIRLEFARTLREDKNPETMRRVRDSDKLIMDTIQGDAAAVAAQIKRVHMEAANPLNAYSEDALRTVIQVAYFAYKDYFIKFEELPTGKGYADIVYFPKKGKGVPALLVELKWNKTPVGAIQQIKDNHYPDALKDYGGKLLLIGISYDKKTKEYECRIEAYPDEADDDSDQNRGTVPK